MAKIEAAFEPTFENVKESLAFELKNLTRVYEQAKKNLDENFAQNLEWVGEEMWSSLYKIDKIMVLCKELDQITLKQATTWMQV